MLKKCTTAHKLFLTYVRMTYSIFKIEQQVCLLLEHNITMQEIITQKSYDTLKLSMIGTRPNNEQNQCDYHKCIFSVAYRGVKRTPWSTSVPINS